MWQIMVIVALFTGDVRSARIGVGPSGWTIGAE